MRDDKVIFQFICLIGIKHICRVRFFVTGPFKWVLEISFFGFVQGS